jgi:hypothetical protein
MSFNPTTSLFSTASGSKSAFAPKPSEANIQNIPRVPLRSRFFHAETPLPYWDEDKENIPIKVADVKRAKGGCLRCYEKAGFLLEPCGHEYSLVI